MGENYTHGQSQDPVSNIFGKVQVPGCAHSKVFTLCTTGRNKGLSWSEHMDAKSKSYFCTWTFLGTRRLN